MTDLSQYTIYGNREVIVINKPEGLVSIPDGFRSDLPNLRDLLIASRGSIWVALRLDKPTSGVIVYAKDKLTHRNLNDQFSKREVKNLYCSYTWGTNMGRKGD